MAINEFGDEIIEDVSLQLNEFGDPIVAAQRTLKPSTQATIAEREAFGQQLQRQAQASPIERGISVATDIGSMIGDLIMSNVRGVGALPEMLSQPQTIIPTALEGTRRAATDLGSFINSIVPVGKIVDSRGPMELIENTLGAVSSPFITPGSLGKVAGSNSLQELITNLMGTSPAVSAIQSLAPKTLTPEEIQRAFEESKAQQGIQDVRTQVDPRFSSAQPEVSEALGKDLPFLIPVKAVRATKGAALEADVGRSVRSAIKVSDAKIANQIEKVAPQEIGNIFARNPNADKAGAFPTEGFANEVRGAYEERGNLISELRAKSGAQFQAGDKLASMIEDRALRAEKAGLKEKGAELRKIAEEKRGSMQNINSLQDAVTEANRQSNIFSPKTSAQELADEIIAKEGGKLINEELGALAGEKGLMARKSWSNLKVINDQLQKRVNKLINSAPTQVQSVIGGSLNSIQGMGSLFAVLNGHIAAGLPPLVESMVRSFIKKAEKEAASSDAIITKMYDQLRKNPPPSTLGQPSVMPLNVGGTQQPLPQLKPFGPPHPTPQQVAVAQAAAENEALNQAMAKAIQPPPPLLRFP